MMKIIVISALVAVACDQERSALCEKFESNIGAPPEQFHSSEFNNRPQVTMAEAGFIKNSWKIVGGGNSASGQFPYMVSLRNDDHFCGGSILNAYWILTAASCVQGSAASSIIVVAGSHLLNSGGDNYTVAKEIRHEDYISWTAQNDIALLKLDSPIQFGTNVELITLSHSNIGGDEAAVFCGWGNTTLPNGSTPNNLQWINLTTITNAKCDSDHNNDTIFDSNVCTFTKKGEGACYRDIGGPLTDASGHQIGIMSWGRPCAIGIPDVFTRVLSFVDWIEDQITNN